MKNHPQRPYVSRLPCSVDGCSNLARPDRERQDAPLCWMHWKRKQRGKQLAKPAQERGESPRESLFIAIRTFSDAEDAPPPEDADAHTHWKRITSRLMKALDRYYARTRGRRTPDDVVHR